MIKSTITKGSPNQKPKLSFPALFRHTNTGEIVIATNITDGVMIASGTSTHPVGYVYSDFSRWDESPSWKRFRGSITIKLDQVEDNE